MDKKTLREKFTQYYLAKHSEDFIRAYDSQKSWLKIQTKIAIRKRQGVVLRVAVSIAAAACVTVGIFFRVIFPDSLPVENMLADRVLNEVRLITGGGQVIILSDTSKMITNTISVKNLGEGPVLVYDSSCNNSQPDRDQPSLQTLEVPRGSTYRIALPDGTMVSLNAETRLTFPRTFGSTREVHLTGEAYFEVAKNQDSPFIVRVRDVNIKVLGTRFCVTGYPELPVQTVLAEGRVRVVNSKDSVTLLPDQKAEISSEGTIRETPVDASVYISWTSGAYEFVDTPLERVIRQIERLYDVQICFADESLKGIRMAGVIYRHADLDHSLRILERAAAIRFIREGNVIKIMQSE